MSDFLVDTNILVYAYDRSETAKKAMAQKVLVWLESNNAGVLSTQVLGEFYHAVTSQRRVRPLTHDEAVAWVQLWKRHDVHPITGPHVDLALELTGRHRVSYYDALILAAARLARCDVVCSEDLSSGHDYGGVTVDNPFLPKARR